MPITEIDRIRIHNDLEQLQELVQRKQYLWERETRTEVKEELASELALHSDLIVTLNALL